MGSNPWDVPMFVVTHRTEDAPPADTGFTFVNGFDDAIAQAVDVAGDREVSVVGGADMVRQALAAGYVRELTITIAPVILGDGKRLFEGSIARSTSSRRTCSIRRSRRTSRTASSPDPVAPRRWVSLTG